ncbi:MAG TPA: efflux RND transporter periplasmic adaptor subunit [Polyangiaceae bacterium]|nr:efflux RND transporter periplasmic adaptor subunit [Polyangiaceae bacterium]
MYTTSSPLELRSRHSAAADRSNRVLPRIASSSVARIVLTLFVALAPLGCHHAQHEKEESAKFQVTSPLRKSTQLTRDYVAQVKAIQHIELRALERGYLQDIFVDEGQQVQRGMKMFQIMPLIYQAEVQKAQAEADLSEVELNNTKLLADKEIVSPSELALAKAKFGKAQAQLALATTHKGLTEIRAPFSGIMGRFQVRKGSLLDEGDPLTTLADNSQIWVYFNVTEAEYLDYKMQHDGEHQTVQLVMANGVLFPESGKVQTIEADFNNETGNIAFRATFPNTKGLLRHGETGKVRMSLPIDDALLIPQKATFEVLDKKFVFVVDEKGVVHSRAITVAAELPQLYVVSEGLEEKEHILIDGLRKVHDGLTIQPDYKKPADIYSHLEVAAE